MSDALRIHPDEFPHSAKFSQSRLLSLGEHPRLRYL